MSTRATRNAAVSTHPAALPCAGRARDNVAVRLFRAPRITVTCDCGVSRQVAYGESYECECGREWSTDSVPADDYAAIRRLDRRYRLIGWIVGLAYGLWVLYTILVHARHAAAGAAGRHAGVVRLPAADRPAAALPGHPGTDADLAAATRPARRAET